MLEEDIIDDEPVVIKKKKVSHSTLLNMQTRKLNEDLEMKLPNEFKGCISNYNHRSISDYGWGSDENSYNY